MKRRVVKTLTILVLVISLLVKDGETACKSETAALYDIHFETFWSRKDFPKHYPEWRPPASWSKMIGFSHDDSFEVFRKGEAATPALKLFAEKADCSLFDLHSQGSGGLFDAFSLPPIASGVGSAKAVMITSGNHTKISAISKIVPSPDWFVGVDSYDLCPNGIWLDYINLELGPLDAGTDKGLTFTSPNWPSDPAEKIQPVTAHYPSHPAGSFYYPNVDELPVLAQLSASKKREFTLRDNFDAADYINVIPESKKDIYKYDIEETKYNLEELDHISKNLPDRLTNHVDIPEEKRRQYLHRRFGKSKNSHGGRIKSNKYHKKNNILNRLPVTIAPKDISDDKGKFNILTIAPNISTTPLPPVYPKAITNRTRLFFPGKRPRFHPAKGRKRIPSGDVMAVIDDIVKDYQKEHRRKIKKRRREERKRRREQMKKIKPPRDCRVSEWGEWSACSKTCGIGEQTRTREILKHARRGGKPCPVLEETTWCGSARACQRDYFRWH